MKVFWAVIKDLLVGEIRNPIVTEVKEVAEAVVSRKDVPLNKSFPASFVDTDGGNLAYVCSPKLSIYIEPRQEFDSIIEEYHYGHSVKVLGYEGRFARIERGEGTAWVLKDGLVFDKKEILPQFRGEDFYDSSHTEVKKLRSFIGDVFLAEDLSLPLQDVEYVWYRLSADQRKIPAINKRPRIAGLWRQLWRGERGVYMSITPMTGSVMEYTTEDGEGKIGYVEAVQPDETITISAVGLEEEAKYTKAEIKKDIWQELRPVFIQFT